MCSFWPNFVWCDWFEKKLLFKTYHSLNIKNVRLDQYFVPKKFSVHNLIRTNLSIRPLPRSHTRPQTTTFLLSRSKRILLALFTHFIIIFLYSIVETIAFCKVARFPLSKSWKLKLWLRWLRNFHIENYTGLMDSRILCLAPPTVVSVAGIFLCAFRTDRTSLGTVPALNLPADTNELFLWLFCQCSFNTFIQQICWWLFDIIRWLRVGRVDIRPKNMIRSVWAKDCYAYLKYKV